MADRTDVERGHGMKNERPPRPLGPPPGPRDPPGPAPASMKYIADIAAHIQTAQRELTEAARLMEKQRLLLLAMADRIEKSE